MTVDLHSASLALSTPFPLPLGALAPIVTGAVQGLESGDWWVPGLRERIGGILRDVSLDRLVSPSQGARPYRIAPALPSANRALLAVGLADADHSKAVLVHIGQASLADGAFFEALNFATLLKPSIIFLIQPSFINVGSDLSPVGVQLFASVQSLAATFQLPIVEVPCDAAAITQAVKQARQVGGPQLIYCRADENKFD